MTNHTSDDPELVEQVAKAVCRVSCEAPCTTCWDWKSCRPEARAAIAAVRAYDEAQVEHLSAFLRAISIRPDEAEMQRADEPATERAPPADGWEAF